MQKLKALFGLLLPKRTVDNIVAEFQKTITKLEAVAKEHTASAQTKDQQAKELADAAQKHREEVERANGVAENLRSVIGTKVEA